MKINKPSAPLNINPNACDGCGVCIDICPAQVFEMVELSKEEINELSFFGRLKVRIKGNVKSQVVHPESCIECGKCVSACHERAISLHRLKQSA